MQTSINNRASAVGEAFFAASRQVWLAGLGAAVVSRDWAQNEASSVLRTLVKEGTVVESRAIRIVGEGVETSFHRASTMWRKARGSVLGAVRDYADGAVTLVRHTIPASLPRIALPSAAPARATKAKPARARRVAVKARAKPSKSRAASTARRTRKATKRA